MRIGVIQASSQADKNALLYGSVRDSAHGSEVVNFGCFVDEAERYSYIEVSVMIGLLLSSGAVDLIVTGCSSGQGMMLACNSMPGVICGYAPTPRDAYLFAQINNGNALSLPLGEGYTWTGPDNLRRTVEALFSEPFGQGWPKNEAERKLADSELLKSVRRAGQKSMTDLLDSLDERLLRRAASKTDVVRFILSSGAGGDVISRLKKLTV